MATPEYPTSAFTPYRTDLVTEASSLGWRPGQYASAIEVGGTSYRLVRTQKDREGEVTAWVYMAADERAVTVYND